MDASEEYLLEAAGSSHLAPLDVSTTRYTVPNHIEGMRTVYSHCGLIVMPRQFPKNSPNLKSFPRTNFKDNQFQRLINQINSISTKRLLWVALSNDWKYFLSENNHLLELIPNASEIWRDYSTDQKNKLQFQIHVIINKGICRSH